MENNKLFLLDAFALIYRAYFAFSKNPLINSKGQNTSAIQGFTSTLLDLLKKENPSHMAVCFDTAATTLLLILPRVFHNDTGPPPRPGYRGALCVARRGEACCRYRFEE